MTLAQVQEQQAKGRAYAGRAHSMAHVQRQPTTVTLCEITHRTSSGECSYASDSQPGDLYSADQRAQAEAKLLTLGFHLAHPLSHFSRTRYPVTKKEQ